MDSSFAPEFPRLGLGTYEMDDPEACADAVGTAVETGYRHVDTAQGYDNEADVAAGLAAADVDADEVFVATKLSTHNLGYEDAVTTARESADRLGVDSIDLLYVHWPIRSYDPAETTRALNDLYEEGVVDAVGLSNFRPDQLADALDRLEAPMVAHQVECHPMLPQSELRARAREAGHALVAYCPIARNRVSEVDEIVAVAEKHDATPAQVSLAWLLSKDAVAPIPKAVDPDHVRENWAAHEIDLDADDVERIDGIERRERIVDFDDAPWNHG